MNAQLLLTPSLFEMSDLAKSRFNERTSETSLNQWVEWVRHATRGNLVRREMQIEVEPKVYYRGLLEECASAFCWDMKRLEEGGSKAPVAPNLTTWFHQYIENCSDSRVNDKPLCSGLPEWWFTNRTARGAAAAKSIIRSVEKLYPFDGKNSKERDAFLSSIHKWSELASACRNSHKKKYQIVASREPTSFMSLGHMNCDKGSCYCVDGCHHYSPLNLGLAKNCYVFYVKEKDGVGPNSKYEVVGRAWGYLDADNMAFTNVYGRKFSGGPRAIEAILRVAAQKWTGKTMPKSNCSAEWEMPPGQYPNGDTNSTHDYVTFESVGREYYGHDENRSPCGDCGDIEQDEEMTWSHYHEFYVCDACRAYYNYCDGHGLVNEDDCVYDDFSGDYILNHRSCETYCGSTCHIDQTVLITMGEHSGEYAYEDDDRLLSNEDGECYIEGTLAEQKKLEESEVNHD